MNRKTYNKWLKRCKDNKTPWTENEIKYFRKALASLLNSIVDADRTDGQYLLETFRSKAPFKITQEQSIKGIEWLKRVCFKSNGQIRESKSRPFERWTCESLKQILPKFKYWTLDDIQNCSDNFYQWFGPVYTLHTKNNMSFSYLVTGQGLVVQHEPVAVVKS